MYLLLLFWHLYEKSYILEKKVYKQKNYIVVETTIFDYSYGFSFNHTLEEVIFLCHLAGNHRRRRENYGGMESLQMYVGKFGSWHSEMISMLLKVGIIYLWFIIRDKFILLFICTSILIAKWGARNLDKFEKEFIYTFKILDY